MADLSDVSWVDAGRVLVGALPILAILAGAIRGPGAFRSRLKHDLDLLEKIPEETEARKLFEDYLAEQVRRFSTLETNSSRNWQNVIIGSALVGAFLALTLYWGTRDHWAWWVVATVPAAFALAGLVYVFEAAQRRPRDDEGNPI